MSTEEERRSADEARELLALCCGYLGTGGKGAIARACRADPSVVTRWLSGDRVIAPNTLASVVLLVDETRKGREAIFQKLDGPAMRYRKTRVTILRKRAQAPLDGEVRRPSSPVVERVQRWQPKREGEPAGRECAQCGASLLVVRIAGGWRTDECPACFYGDSTRIEASP